MRIRDVSQPPVSFQLAPMIDIVFLLLIFFLVTYQITEQEKEMQVAVPTSEEGANKARVANEIVINLTKGGVISVSGETYTKEELSTKLEKIVIAAETAGQLEAAGTHILALVGGQLQRPRQGSAQSQPVLRDDYSAAPAPPGMRG